MTPCCAEGERLHAAKYAARYAAWDAVGAAARAAVVSAAWDAARDAECAYHAHLATHAALTEAP